MIAFRAISTARAGNTPKTPSRRINGLLWNWKHGDSPLERERIKIIANLRRPLLTQRRRFAMLVTEASHATDRHNPGVTAMTRSIEIANAESAVTRWSQYTDAARAADDQKRVAFGEIRLANAQRRLKKWLRP